MKNIKLTALNTIKEIRRHKIFYALSAGALFLITVGFVLAGLSITEQTRLVINFSFTACHIGLIAITIYFASLLISQEIETGSIMTVLSRPISKSQFLFGKFLGLVLVLLVIALALTAFMVCVYVFYEKPLKPILFIAMWGIFLEAVILSSVCFMFSSLTSSFLTLVFSFFLFLIGHLANGIVFFLKSQEGGLLKPLTSVVLRILPNFEKLNWRGHALYEDPLSLPELLSLSLYGLSWAAFFLILAVWLFKRKNIV